MNSDQHSRLVTLLGGLESVLRQERELFGEVLITEDVPHERSGQAMSSRPYDPSGEPSLFGPPAPAPLTSEPWGTAPDLASLDAAINTCVKCPLGHTRTKFVFGVGNPRATLMLVGEGPGADEDAQGEPFVGRAGQLLNKILEAIHFRREEVYICNIVKCRPPNNRTPSPEEAETCLPYLRKQIALVNPKVILCLGMTAAKYLLGTNESLGSLRGRVIPHDGIPCMVTYHPAALLRNPNWKRPAWEDVQAVRVLHDRLLAGGS